MVDGFHDCVKMSKMHILYKKETPFQPSYDAKKTLYYDKSLKYWQLPGPLLWDRVARIVHDIDHFDNNESTLEILSCFADIKQKCFQCHRQARNII